MAIINLKENKIPSGWSICHLTDFTHLEMGQSPPSSTYNHDKKGLPFFQGKAEFGDLYPTENKYCSAPNKIAKAGATLLTVRAPVGPTNLAKVDCCIGRGLAGIHPLDDIEDKFILFLMRSIEHEISGQGTGSTFTAINKTFLEELSFALPPLNEQKRIVDKIEELFSELDNGIESLKTTREKLSVYRQAILKHAFEGKLTQKWREDNGITEEWSEDTIGNLCQINPKHKDIDDDLEISFVPMPALNQETARIDQHETRKFGEVKKGYTHFVDNDVLFAKITPCMENGKNGLATNLKNGVACGSTEFMVFRCGKKILPQFLLMKFRDTLFRRIAEANMTGAVGQRRVPKPWMEKVIMPLPSIKEQEVIVKEVQILLDQMNKIEEDIDYNLNKTEALRQSILKEAFSGKLVAQNPTDEPASVLLQRIKAEKNSSVKPKKKRKAA